MFTIHNQAFPRPAGPEPQAAFETVEFSMPGVEKTWKDTAKTIGLTSLKIIIFPWALYEGTSWCTGRLIMCCAYPAQSSIAKCCLPHLRRASIYKTRMKISQEIITLSRQPILTKLKQLSHKEQEFENHKQELMKEQSDPLKKLRVSFIIKNVEQEILFLQQQQQNLLTQLEKISNPAKYLIKQVILKTNGIHSHGIMIETIDTANNGKWVLQAAGNNGSVEHLAALSAVVYGAAGCNVLLMNNPGVGESEGTATPQSIGATQNSAIEFLKTEKRATHIILAGYSLGGAAIGQAILQRNFKNDEEIKFFVLRQATFSKLSEISKHHVSPCIAQCSSSMIQRFDCELDNIKASHILAQNNIAEVTIQAADDSIVPLQYSLQSARTEELRDLLPSPAPIPHAKHHDLIPIMNESYRQVRKWIEWLATENALQPTANTSEPV